MLWNSKAKQKKINQFLEISGKYNYHVEVSTKGNPPYPSSILSINAFTDSKVKYAIPISCKWFRVRGKNTFSLLGLNSNTYQLSAQDIGFYYKLLFFFISNIIISNSLFF